MNQFIWVMCILVLGENMVPESSHEVAQFQGARIAGQRRIEIADASDQKQSSSGFERLGDWKSRSPYVVVPSFEINTTTTTHDSQRID